MFAWIADRIAGRLRADSKHFSVDADLPPYDKQFHDIAEDDDSEHSGFTSKGSRTTDGLGSLFPHPTQHITCTHPTHPLKQRSKVKHRYLILVWNNT